MKIFDKDKFINDVIKDSEEAINQYKKQIISATKEIERLNKEIKEKDNEIIRLDYKYGECKKQELNEYAKNRELRSIIKEVREDLHQVVKWCTENKHNEDTIDRYLVVDYGTIVGKINEIRTKLDKVDKENIV